MKNGQVEGLAFRFKGKRDKKPVVLMAWRDDEMPIFCPVRHLLVWMRLTGIVSGYFFPPKKLLRELETDGSNEPIEPSNVVYNTHITKAVYNCVLNRVCKQVIPRRRGPWGTHTGRKTYYLFGVWGGASDMDLMEGARHATIANARRYKQDAAFLLELVKRNGEHLAQAMSRQSNEHVQPHEAVERRRHCALENGLSRL